MWEETRPRSLFSIALSEFCQCPQSRHFFSRFILRKRNSTARHSLKGILLTTMLNLFRKHEKSVCHVHETSFPPSIISRLSL